MYVDYVIYTSLGYSKVPETEFIRWSIMAEQTVRMYTQNRITDEDITEINQRGVCEIIDMFYADAQPESQKVVSFSSGKYSETYLQPETLDQQINKTMRIYFTADQLWRGF